MADEVSILVLMELGFEPEMYARKKKKNGGFYPCFNGIRVRTV